MKKTFEQFLSEEFREKTERIVIGIAIISYLLHLLIIFLVNQGVIDLSSKLTKSPISAVYTPFSFILVYEVFLLVFYLPRSISSYIGKQYEIITLIVIRRIFKDIGSIELSSEWFKLKNDLQFSYDVATALILFFLIQKFYQKIGNKGDDSAVKLPNKEVKVSKFILLKRNIAMILVPVLAILAFTHSLIGRLSQ